jgi:hypothetical protein
MPVSPQRPSSSAAARETAVGSRVPDDALAAFRALPRSGMEDTVREIIALERMCLKWPRLAAMVAGFAFGAHHLWRTGDVAEAGILVLITAGLLVIVASLGGMLLLRLLLPRHGVPWAVASAIRWRTEERFSGEDSGRLVDRNALMLQAAADVQRGARPPR